MRSSKKRYDAEFKREAVRLADNSEKGDSRIERELGLYQGAIRTWRKALLGVQAPCLVIIRLSNIIIPTQFLSQSCHTILVFYCIHGIFSHNQNAIPDQ